MNDDLILAIKVAMDNSSFQQGIQNLKREMSVVQSQFQASTAGIKDWGKNLDSMKGYADALSQKIDIQRKIVQAYQEQLDKSKKSLEDNAKKMLETKEKVEQSKKAWEEAKKTLGENAEETQKLKTEYEKLKKEYDQQEQKVRNNQKSVEGYTIQLNQAKTALNNMETELRETTTEIDRQGNAWLKLSEKTKEVGEKLKSVGDKMTSVGKDLSMKITAPIVGAGAAAVKFASDLNESLNKVEVAFRNNANEVKNWSDTTLQKFGIAKGTALDMAAGFGDMATSMGLNTKQASEMSMELVGLAGDLASFKNISIDVANTALTSVFTGETESLKKLGIVMTEANLQEYALSKGIKTRVKDMSEAEKVQLRYNFVMEKTINAHGDFERTGAGTANQMRIFQESLKQLAETFGQQILPVITPTIAKLNEMIQKFAGLDDHTKKIIVVFAGVVAAIGPLLIIVGKLISAVGTISSAFGTLTGVMATAGAGATATGGMFAALTGPIGIAVAAIAGLIAIFVVLYKNNEDFRNSVNTVWNGVKNLISSVIESLKAMFQAFIALTNQIWKKYGDDFVKIIITAFNLVATIVNTTLKAIQDVIKIVTSAIKGDWKGVWEGIKNLTSDLWNGIKNVIKSAIGLVKIIIKTELEFIKNIISGIWNGIIGITLTVWKNVKSAIENPINAAKNTVYGIINTIKMYFSGLRLSIPSIGIGTLRLLVTSVSNTINTIKRYFSGLRLSLPSIKIPHIPLPHFSIKGSFSIVPPSVPHLAVNWYASGGIFNRPSVIGVGEAGPEAVIPINRLKELLGGMGGSNKITINVVTNSADRIVRELKYQLGGGM